MSALLPSYDCPSGEEFATLWREGLFVLDTNALLDLYRLPRSARDATFEVLTELQNQLWIPHQVCVEFERNRLSVINAQRSSLESLKMRVEEQHTNLKIDIDKVALGQRSAIDVEGFLNESRQLYSKLESNVDNALKDQPAIANEDEVRAAIVRIFESRTGSRPTQSRLDEIFVEGETRYELKQPPGFLDMGKGKNLADARYICDGLVFQAKYGDLVFWLELIEKARDAKATHVALVTSERGEDWWHRYSGKTLGPHPSLVQEMQQEGGASVFWMYDLNQFLQRSKDFKKTKINESLIREVDETLKLPPNSNPPDLDDFLAVGRKPGQQWAQTGASGSPFPDRLSFRQVAFQAERAVLRWLSEQYPTAAVREQGGYPDFIVDRTDLLGQKHGFNVVFAPTDLGLKIGIDGLLDKLQWARNASLKQLYLDSLTTIVAFGSIGESPIVVEKIQEIATYMRAAVGTANVVFGVYVNGQFLLLQLSEHSGRDDYRK